MIKKILIVLLVLIVAIGVLSFSCGGSVDEDPVAEDPVAEDPVSDVDHDGAYDVYLILQDNMSENYHISMDKEGKTFFITPNSEDFAYEVTLAIGGDPQSMEDWDNMVSSSKELSQSIYERSGYAYAVRNPLDTDRILLVISNGIVLYDVVHDG